MRNAAYLSRDTLEALGFAHLGADVRLHETCVLVGCEHISIGDNVRIDPFCVITAHETVEIGSHTHIASYAALMGASGISIGEFCGVSMGARLLSASDDFSAGALMGPHIPDEFRSVRIGRVRMGRHTCVGANSVVLPATHMGEGATVGALSLVRGEVAAWTVSAGVPAKVIGQRDREGVLRAEGAFKATRNG